MALSNFTELKAALADWLDGSPLGGREADFIALCEDEINARLGVAIGTGATIRPMMQRDPVTIDAEYVDMPDGNTVRPLTLEVEGLDRPWSIPYISPDSLVGFNYGAAEQRSALQEVINGNPPRFYSIIGDEMRFYPVPQAPLSAIITRFVKIPALSDATASNWVLASHRNVYLYGSLAQASMFGWNDAGMSNWGELFQQAMDGLIARYPVQNSQAPLPSDLQALVGRNGMTFDGFMSGQF